MTPNVNFARLFACLAALGKLLADETEKWAKVIKAGVVALE
jgi:hypothetical protein